MKRVLVVPVVAILVLGLVGVAFLVGYWPEHRRRQALEERLSDVGVELAQAGARVRLGDLLGQMLALEDAVAAQDYGRAQALASTLFDAARLEATRLAPGPSRAALEHVVQLRDPVTAGLARLRARDPGAGREREALLRDAPGSPRRVRPGSPAELASVAASGS